MPGMHVGLDRGPAAAVCHSHVSSLCGSHWGHIMCSSAAEPGPQQLRSAMRVLGVRVCKTDIHCAYTMICTLWTPVPNTVHNSV